MITAKDLKEALEILKKNDIKRMILDDILKNIYNGFTYIILDFEYDEDIINELNIALEYYKNLGFDIEDISVKEDEETVVIDFKISWDV